MIDETPLFSIKLLPDGGISIDTGIDSALKWSPTVIGPWLNIGKGQTFTLDTDMPAGFFQRFSRLGGIVGGTVSDSSGKPLVGLTVGLAYGGPSATTASNGNFELPRLPFGTNLITITNPIGTSLSIPIPAISKIPKIGRSP